MTDLTNIIIAATALVAVIVGPIVSLYVARRQIRASVVSTNRQAWINSLRDAIADFMTAEQIVFLSKNTGFFNNADAEKAFEKMILLVYRIRLLVNSKEPNHTKLLELLRKESEELAKALSSQPNEHNKRQSYDEEIITLAQIILKKEWVRVKRGD